MINSSDRSTRSLEIEIKLKGRVWWRSAKSFARDPALSLVINETQSIRSEDLFYLRRMGKTFQLCLLACRHMLEGQRVLFKSEDQHQYDAAFKVCCEILEKSFPNESLWTTRKVPSYSISSIMTGGSIQFMSTEKSDRGYNPTIILEDTLLESSNVSHVPVVNSRTYLLNLLREEPNE